MTRQGSAAPRARLLAALAIIGVAAAAATVTAARAQDTLAPPGASARWLPCEEWVYSHWLPYDEQKLLTALHTDRDGIRRWLRGVDPDGHMHTLSELAQSQGRDPRSLADELVSAWRGPDLDAAGLVLRDRALRTLTQSHLAYHVFFHFAHDTNVALNAQRIFGVSPLAYGRLRMAGDTPAEIGRLNGRSRHQVAVAALQVLTAAGERGVTLGATPATQARRFLALQRQHLDAWLAQRIAAPGPVRAGPDPEIRSPQELACWLFGGLAGRDQVRQPSPGPAGPTEHPFTSRRRLP